ncbi:MAG: hypothetical protein Kow0032_23070 [Methyloligellaceae bacterium]
MLFSRVIPVCVVVLGLTACASGNSMRSVDDTTKAFLRAASTWDSNRDGVSSCDEWEAYAKRLFKEADADGNGYLDGREYGTLGGRDALFISVPMTHFDTSRDNRITEAELAARRNPAFARLDTNNDCGITVAEIAAGPHDRKPTITREDLLKDRSVR